MIPLSFQAVAATSAALRIAEPEAHGAVATVRIARPADVLREPQACGEVLGRIALGSREAQRAIPFILHRLTTITQALRDRDCAPPSMGEHQSVVVAVEGEAEFSTEIRKGLPPGTAAPPDGRHDHNTATVTLTF